VRIFSVITIFPELVEGYTKSALLRRAAAKKLLKVEVVNLRDFSRGRHKKVDDVPFGGGPGMVMRVEPIFRAVQKLKASAKGGSASGGKSSPASPEARRGRAKLKTRIILFSTRGEVFNQKAARRLARYDRLIFIAGRYEGVDERVALRIADEEISMGDFVLAGGELPALTVIEAVARHIPGVLGKSESLEEAKGSYPVYTRPAVFEAVKGKTWRVPDVLQSGDHRKIAEWRKRHGR